MHRNQPERCYWGRAARVWRVLRQSTNLRLQELQASPRERHARSATATRRRQRGSFCWAKRLRATPRDLLRAERIEHRMLASAKASQGRT